MNRHVAAVLFLIALLLVGVSFVSAQEEPKPAPKPEASGPDWYRIDVALNEFEDGKKINTRAYTLEAWDNGDSAELRLGDRVPVATAAYGSGNDDNQSMRTSYQYIDVGLNITCKIYERSGRIGLYIVAEQSSIIPNQVAQGSTPQQATLLVRQPVIRQLKMGPSRTFVTLGKPMLITSVDDPGKANHKYTIEATVTKINP